MNRQAIIDALSAALEPLDDARAAWLGGADASGRLDEWSDIDFVLIARDDAVQAMFEAAERALASVAPIEDAYRLPKVLGGHSQKFYKLEGVDPFLLVDFFIMRLSAEDRLLERERHGEASVLFDKDGLTAPAPLDQVAHQGRIDERLADLRGRFPMFQGFVTKAILRDQPTDAMNWFRSMTLIPLVELLRIRHCSDRFDFGLRYLDRDLPADLKRTIDRLSYASSMTELQDHHTEAIALFARYVD